MTDFFLHTSPSPPYSATPHRRPAKVNIPYSIPHASRIPLLIQTEPSSPSTPKTPTESALFPPYLPSSAFSSLAASIHEPYSIRIRGPFRSDHRPTFDRPRPKQTFKDCASPVEGDSSPSLATSIGSEISIRMSVGGAMKRKVVIMGSPSVGKTSLTQQYVAPPTYNESYFPTIEHTSHKHVKYEGDNYECELIDSAGQDEYTLFPAKYAVGVHGYLLVYSINSRQSFEMVKTVHGKILDFAGLEKVPCVIVGQKCDLIAERRVTVAEGEALAKKLSTAFVESSAKDNKNVGKAFDVLLYEMKKEYNPAPEKKKSSWFGWGR